MKKIVRVDNSILNYPDESFLNLPPLDDGAAQVITTIINNECTEEQVPLYWKVVEVDYNLPPSLKDRLRNR